jgi:hypothetical protein
MALAFCLWSPGYENLPNNQRMLPQPVFTIFLTDSEIYVIS